MKSQDVLVAVAIAASKERSPSYAALAAELGLSASETHSAVKRLQHCGILDRERRVIRSALSEFILHGLKYVFPAELGSLSLGVPTTAGAPGLRQRFAEGETLVWPSPRGTVRGIALKPLYRSVPDISLRDEKLHEWFALIDCLRAGRARERQYAAQQLARRLAADEST